MVINVCRSGVMFYDDNDMIEKDEIVEDDFRGDEDAFRGEEDAPRCEHCCPFMKQNCMRDERQQPFGPQPGGPPFGQPFGPQPGGPPFGQPFGPQPGVPPFGQPFGPQPGVPPFGQPFGPQPGVPPFGMQPGGPGFGGPPAGPPPGITPQIPGAQPFGAPGVTGPGIGIQAVDAGAIRRCVFRYVYIWPRNRRGFWAWLVFVGPRSVAGWRWDGRRWIYFGMDLRQITSFRCY